MRTLLLTATTLAVLLGGAVGIYYFYIQARTDYLDARNERVLARMRSNMLERSQIYKENVRTTAEEDLKDLSRKVMRMYNEEVIARFQQQEEMRRLQMEAEAARTDKKMAQNMQQSMRLADTPPPANLDSSLLVRRASQVEVSFKNQEFRINSLNGRRQMAVISFDAFQVRYSERINLSFALERVTGGGQPDGAISEGLQPTNPQAPYNQYEITDRVQISLDQVQNEREPYTVRLTLDMHTFMQPLLRPDVFDHFLILRDTSQRGPRPENVVFTTLEDKRVALATQRLLPKLTALQPDSSAQQILDRLPYRLYPQSMQFQGEEVVILGMVSDAHFDQQRQQVSTVLILLLSILIFVMLLSFPILKMALMGPYERMRLDDLLLASFTAILGTSLITLLLIDFYGYNGPDRMQRQRQLMALSEAIEARMLGNIKALNRQLQAYDTIAICDRLMRRNVLAYPESSAMYPQHFPFFKEVFWVENQRLARQWSSSSRDIPLVNVAGRSYYEDLMNGQGWRLPDDSLGTDPFTLASIRTRVNGDLAAIVARRSQRSLVPTSADSDTLRGSACAARDDLLPCDIIMASADLPSVVNPLLPPGFGFAVIDQEGKVLFHDDAERNLQENLLEEIDLPSLKAAMYTRSPLYDQGIYLGDGYDFYLQPVGKLPIFLVSFRKRNYYQLAHAQIISLTLLLTLATFLAGLTFVGIVVLFSPRNPVIKHDQFAFDWLRPFHRHRRRYRELIANNLYTLLLAGIFTANNVQPLVAISIIATSYVFTFLLVFLRLNKNAHQQFMWAEYQRIAWLVITLLVAGNLAMYAALETADFHRILLYELLQSIILLGVIGRIFAESQARGTGWVRRLYDWYAEVERKTQAGIPGLNRLLDGLWRVLDAQRSYRLFLTTWLLILGVFPVVKFYEIAYNRESRLQVRFAQIEMAKELIARRDALEMRYRYLPNELRKRYRIDERVAAYQQKRDAAYQARLDSVLAANPQAANGPARDSLQTATYLQYGQRLDSIYQAKIDSIYQIPDRRVRDLVAAFLKANTYPQPYFQTSLTLDPDTSALPPNVRAADDPTRLAPGYIRYQSNARYRIYDSTLSALRPRYDDLALRTKQLRDRGSANAQWTWTEYHGSKRWLVFHYGDRFRLTSELPFYHFPTFSYAHVIGRKDARLMIFWVLLGLFLVLIYALVRFMIYKLFGRAALRIPTPDPIVAKRTLLDSEESIFLMVPLRAVEQDYLSVIDIKVADSQETYYRPVPSRSHYYYRLDEEKDMIRLRALMDRTPSPLDPGKVLDLDPKGGGDAYEQDPKQNMFQRNQYTLYDLPVLVLDEFEHMSDNSEAYEAHLNLIEDLLDYGIQVIIISVDEPVAIQERYADLMAGGEAAQEPLRMRYLQRMGRLLSSFSKIDYPMERWAVFDYAEEALEFIQGKHAFLHVTSPAVLGTNQRTRRTLRTLQVELESAGIQRRTIRKTTPDTNTLVIDETYNDVLLDDRLETIHRWLEFDEKRPMTTHQITVVSTITPLQIEEIYRNSGCEEEELRSKLRAWRRVLSLFYKGIVSDDPRRVPPEERVADLIRRECVHGPFLQSIQDELLDQLDDYNQHGKGDRELKEEVILRIENRAHLYYQSLWAACTKEERYLIFDLAQDGLINASNLTGLTSLIRKGIVIQTPDTLTLMNKSFRNFVLTVVKPVDALRMELEIESQDLWRRLRTPISIILFALGGFVFYTQRDILNETLAFVTGVAALIPTLSRVLEAVTTVNLLPNMFRRKKKEE